MSGKHKRAVGKKTQKKTKQNIAIGKNHRRKFFCRSTGRSTANGQIFHRWGLRLTIRSTVAPNQRVKLSVGRPSRLTRLNREQGSCSRSTARSTEMRKYTLVHIGRPTEQICSAYGRPLGRLTKGQRLVIEIFLKPIFFRQNNF